MKLVWASLVLAILSSTTMARSDEAPVKPDAKGAEDKAGAEPRPRPTGGAPAAVAPDPWPKGAKVVQKVIHIKNENVSVEDVARLLNVFPVRVSTVRGLGTIAVAGTPEAVASVEEVVRQIDVPHPASQRRADKNVEFVAHLILAQHTTGGGLDPLPAELDPVLAQLKGLLTYKSYGLVDTLLLRTREGNATDSSGTIRAIGQALQGGSYSLGISRIGVSADEKGRVIGAMMMLEAHVIETVADGHQSDRRGRINATIDLREGQKVVVGKSTIDGNQSALILVLSAKVID